VSAAVSNEGSPCIWIIKPVGLSRGRGIRLVDDIYKLTYSEMVRPLDTCINVGGLEFDRPQATDE
jgi:hypothetical protein